MRIEKIKKIKTGGTKERGEAKKRERKKKTKYPKATTVTGMKNAN